MEEFKVFASKGKIIVDSNLLAIFYKRNKNTIRNWKNSKSMPVYEILDGINYFDIMEVHDWKKINIKERFSNNKSKEIEIETEDDFKLDLPYGLELADIDLENSLHLSILAAHPMGELIRDTLDFVLNQDKKQIEINTKNHDYQVKKGKYLKVEELNSRMTEFMALVKDSDINARAKFPIEIAEELLASDLIVKESKTKTQEIISTSIDEVQNEKYKMISTQFMKHIIGKTKKVTISFLEDMIKILKEKDTIIK